MLNDIGPTGSVVRGNIWDVDKAKLERAFKAYDRLLYITWNPRKRNGYGCWELRRLPEKKSLVTYGEFEGKQFLSIEPVELDIVNHVLDMPILSFRWLEKLQKMDTWKTKNWVDEMESAEEDGKRRVKDAAHSEMHYMIKQHKREFRELKELLLSGFNPARLAQYWGKDE